MIPHDPGKSGYQNLPVPHTNGHNYLPPAPVPSGALTVEGDFAGHAAAGADGGEVSLGRALGRCWLSAALFGLLAAAVGGGATWYLWPTKFTAQALLHVPPRPGTFGEDLQQHVRTQSALFKSGKVAQAALATPEVTRLSFVRDEADPLSTLVKNLQVDSNLGPEMLRVNLSGENPEELRVLLDAMARIFVEEAGVNEQNTYQARMKQLLANKQKYEADLREKRNTLQGLEERYGQEAMQTPAQRYEQTNQQLNLLRRDLRETQVELKALIKELESLSSRAAGEGLDAASDAAVEEYLRQDERYRLLQAELLKLTQEEAQLRRIATGDGLRNELEKTAARRALLEQSLDDRRKEVRPLAERSNRTRGFETARENRTRLEARRAGLEEKERQLQTHIEKVANAGKEPGRRLPEVDSTRDAIAALELAVKKINEQIDGLKIDSPAGSRVTILEPASVPKSRNTDKQTKMAGAAGAGAFCLLFAGVLWREIRTRRVYGAAEAANRLGATLLGTLPVLPAEARRNFPAQGETTNAWQAAFSESMDAIRTQLLRAAQTEGLKVVMITSAVSGEGKTSLASHLALSLARAWRKTLLLDGDLRKPSLHRQFELNNELGFCDVLRGEAEFADVVRPTPVSRLWIVPAGQWDAHALQALAQDTVSKLFEGLRDQYDFVIIDSSPVLPVADTLSLGQHVDGVIFSILRDVSRYPTIQAAQQRLASVDICLLGTVVLGAKEDATALGYNIGYQGRTVSRV